MLFRSETHRRLNHAVELYEEKVIEYILCVGGARPRFNVFGSESMRQFLIDAGVPEGRVFAEKKSFDTITNWYMARQIIQGYGGNRVIAVSSPFHLYRFRQIVNSEPNSRVKVFYSPYILKRSSPSITFFDIWKQVRYEWLAMFPHCFQKVFTKDSFTICAGNKFSKISLCGSHLY